MGDSFDTIWVEHLGIHESNPLDPKILGDANGAGDVDDVLRVDQD
jgi:hypothetical protein